MEPLSAKPSSIGALFGSDKKYVIPRFQREYSWDKDQINEFMEDLQGLVGSENTKEPYFFGPMVFVNDNESDDEIRIADGQQRLTTSAIFIAAVRDILYELGKNDAADVFHRHIQEKNMETEETFDRLVLSDRNKDYFHYHMNHKNSQEKIQEKADPNNTCLQTAYKIIYEKLKKMMREGPDPAKYLITLCDRFTKRFMVIEITVSKIEYAYRIFETLNDRGLGLSQGDLVKNYFLEKCGGSESEDEVFGTWEEIIETLTGTSPKDRIDMDDFLRHFWLGNYNEKIKIEQVYEKITEKITEKTSVMKFVKLLKEQVEHYDHLVRPKKEDWADDEEIVNQLTDLKTLNSTVCYVALLIGAIKLENKEFKQLLAMCINFFFRYKTIMGLHATQLENLMIAVAYSLRKGDDLNYIKKTHFLTPKIYPDDSDFENSFKNFTSNLKTAMYVLLKLHGKKTDKVKVECIMPKNIKGTEWETSLKNQDDLKSYVDQWYPKLGNMTLIENDMKIDKKKYYTEKLEYYRKSNISMTNQLPDVANWNDEHIKKRQQEFAAKAKAIWKIE